MTQRWKLTIEYDGTSFCGWQRQKEEISVQQVIEEAVYKFCGEKADICCAGRTDAGVHALGQVAHVDIARHSTEKEVRDAINAHLRGHAVSILKAEAVEEGFHARFGATHRVYCYKILTGRVAPPAIGASYVWHVKRDLDVEAMHRAAQYLLGEHDFSSFRASACQAKSPIRTMKRLDVIEKDYGWGFGRHIEIWAESRSFLHHQIRNMTGTLKLVGEGAWQAEDVKLALEAKDRAAAGTMAPSSGLYFVRVDY